MEKRWDERAIQSDFVGLMCQDHFFNSLMLGRCDRVLKGVWQPRWRILASLVHYARGQGSMHR